MKSQTEIQALQNAATRLGINIKEWYNEDKRKTIQLYFATLNSHTISPKLDYEQMNHFLLGYSKAQNLAEYTVIFTYNTDKRGVIISEAKSPKDAIKKAIQRMDDERRNYNSVECICNI